MDEKTMVSDALVGINGELKMYAEYITQIKAGGRTGWMNLRKGVQI